ncbi:MexE family multidrug efflux RND transporter periplasmic adaptor subunit [Arenimonas soli]|uniref:MexE family multidrug efflux RND transporter periplasmic adaptor subunit n=1 Tax=Arenimonas soli TaxID=2269504 RepID=A0ABQ1HD73_9GAMM|nr:efflux RND transporter periplasmic adaptor subunit [Arenimonas soli]GGA71988.1 MexE family multidrug efflux RND transporter periplasmic adaptor subunit [Arenimonas soli]
MNARPITRLLHLAGFALAVAITAACGSQAQEHGAIAPAQVSVAPVESRSITPWDEFTGRVAAIETVQLRPRVSGYVESVEFTEGQEVKKGQVLFVLDDRSYRAALDRAEAELSRARSHAALADSELRRARQLAAEQLISAELLEQRRAATAQAASEVRSAQALVAQARLDLDFTRVRAPIDGMAGRALVTTGNLAAPDSTVLTTLVSLDPVHVYFESDEQTYLRHAKNGGNVRGARNPVHVGLAGESGHPHEGELDFIDNQVDARTGTIRARAVLPNPDRTLTPGLYARVQLVANSPEPALLVDDKAVLTDQDRKYVYVVGENNTAERRDVSLGRLVDGLRVVEQGLSEGDQVVVGGVQRIFFPGMPLDPRPAGEPASIATAAAVASAH